MKRNTMLSILVSGILFAGCQTAHASFDEVMYFNQIYAHQNGGIASQGSYGNGKCGYEFKNKTYYYDCNKYSNVIPLIEDGYRVVKYFDKDYNIVKTEEYYKSNHLVFVDESHYPRPNCSEDEYDSSTATFYDLNGKITKKYKVNGDKVEFYNANGTKITKKEFEKIKEY